MYDYAYATVHATTEVDIMLKHAFTQHPASVGETYGEHFASALSFAGWLFVAALACSIHAVLPFAFQKSASQIVQRLQTQMLANRRRHAAAGTAAART